MYAGNILLKAREGAMKDFFSKIGEIESVLK